MGAGGGWVVVRGVGAEDAGNYTCSIDARAPTPLGHATYSLLVQGEARGGVNADMQ